MKVTETSNDKSIILIADSGSTKTDWRFAERSGKILLNWNTVGFNPYFLDSEEMLNTLSIQPFAEFKSLTKEIWFYGSGCLREEKKIIIRDILSKVFSNAMITVESDLTGACRALFGNNPGIGAILGTGASSALYDGNRITYTPPSLGYILGDEGSGSHIGKILMKDILTNRLPEDLMVSFQSEMKLTSPDLMNRLYNQPQPNRFLASLAKFLLLHREHEYSKEIIGLVMTEFFETHLVRYHSGPTRSLGFCGSVAFYTSDILIELGRKYGFKNPEIIKSPIEKLTLYHIKP
jgi:glucosamine kinase